MARKVEADVEINDKSSKGLGSFLAGLRKAEDQTRETQRGIDKTSASTGKLSKETEENAKAFKRLSSELEVSKKELGQLAKAFADAGTAAERTDISKAMRKQQSEISKLTKNSNILKDLIPDEPKVQNLTDRLKQSFEDVSAAAPQIIGAGIAAAAPLAGSLLSAGIIGGAGLGGIVGGVVVASKDPRVQAAFAGMKTRIGSELATAGQPFVDTTIAGIGDIEKALDSIDFKAIFAQSAQNAGPVIDGITTAIRGLGRGVQDLIAKSGPVLNQLGDSIGDLGVHAGEFLSTVSQGSVGAAAGLRDVTNTLDTALDVLGPTILGLTDLYGVLSKVGVAGQFLTGLLGPIGQVGDLLDKMGVIGGDASGQLTLAHKGIDQASTSVTAFSGALQAANAPLSSFTNGIVGLTDAGRNLYDSQTQARAAVDAVSKSIKENGRSLSANTEKGRANRSAISAVVAALNANYQSYAAVNGEGAKANGIAAKNQATFEQLAAKFGKSKTQADALARALGLIPPRKDVHVNTNADSAKDQIRAIQQKINSLHGKSVDVIVHASVSNKVANTLDRFGGTFDATQHFAFAGAGGGLQRSGGPLPVDLFSNVTSNLYLDGRLVYADTARQVRAASKRDAWRQKVGRR